jgi:hypothetical protein
VGPAANFRSPTFPLSVGFRTPVMDEGGNMQPHDLKVERFLNEQLDGPIKTFTLRGIKDSPPYLHDGRLLTFEDTVSSTWFSDCS